MNEPVPGTFAAVLGALGTGLPNLLLQFLLTLALLALGTAIYMALTPFNERRLISGGNSSAALVLGGTVVALAIPLASLLATTPVALDLLVWGLVAVVLQLVTFQVASRLLGALGKMIEADQIAGAILLVAIQLAVALLNAAAMVPA
ncbi:conserved membrane protein of unknown function [Rhodovastum atsumiense]|uniref:DUF350 domain-containing protein n=1 Tax=Rhodovastum atsumiense TaxID=504468 RepID=A0A5M6IID5_9PROT|nr:DUF350 domain-containing protein [Rhodovastum atsumiense]KAA5608031.1 DUF350 domain-containing protein [Rhodovastum atsumiense]CAH2604980.1 conserved membrane protein of unknown function [Rhodovastum atsumiense]